MIGRPTNEADAIDQLESLFDEAKRYLEGVEFDNGNYRAFEIVAGVWKPPYSIIKKFNGLVTYLQEVGDGGITKRRRDEIDKIYERLLKAEENISTNLKITFPYFSDTNYSPENTEKILTDARNIREKFRPQKPLETSP